MVEFTSKHSLGLNQLNHYVTQTLQEYSYDAAIHFGINDILRSKHYDELDKLPEI